MIKSISFNLIKEYCPLQVTNLIIIGQNKFKERFIKM